MDELAALRAVAEAARELAGAVERELARLSQWPRRGEATSDVLNALSRLNRALDAAPRPEPSSATATPAEADAEKHRDAAFKAWLAIADAPDGTSEVEIIMAALARVDAEARQEEREACAAVCDALRYKGTGAPLRPRRVR